MAKLIQICASQNDWFGLDVDGGVYQYNFKVSTWTKLAHDRARKRMQTMGARPSSMTSSRGEVRDVHGEAPPDLRIDE